MYEMDYALLKRQLASLLEGEDHWLPNLANTSALLYEELPDLNWAGFYLLTAGELVLGPFQGKPACVRIALGRGVCGTAAQRRESIVVPDVHAFPGHIACDAASRSELVIPLIAQDGRLLGVLDLDSPTLGRFTDQDAEGLKEVVEVLVAATIWPEKF
ncbi:MAG: GAF domain-containing protein [Firmicutes bacterium]|nr:GAF domain-containing protein [Bacillota bacterium]